MCIRTCETMFEKNTGKNGFQKWFGNSPIEKFQLDTFKSLNNRHAVHRLPFSFIIETNDLTVI